MCFSQQAVRQKVPKQPYFKYSLSEKENSDSITFYLSEFSDASAQPLLIYIQGSGYSSLFNKAANGNVVPASGHVTWTYSIKDKARLLIIEKPGVSYLSNDKENPNFDKRFSLDTWAARIIKTIRYVIKNEKIDTTKIMVVGHSEGGLAAAKVANDLQPLVSHVSILAGEGPSQLYSLYKLTEKGDLFYTENPSKEKRLDSLQNAWQTIQSDPTSVKRKFWGLTFLRWSTFLKTSVCDQLSKYNGKIFIVQGDSDKQVYPESATILYTTLITQGKFPKLEIILGADHSFNIVNDKNKNGWDEISKKCIDWFLR
jgi:esterase/lipase